MVNVTIHQPGYLPWLGFFDKMIKSDIFVLLDDVQYEKNYFDNRNKIKTPQGALWLTVPVKVHLGQKLNEVTIENSFLWKKKHYKSLISSYRKSLYFERHEPFFEQLYVSKWEKLIDINVAIIEYLIQEFSIKTRLIRSSELEVPTSKGERIFDICAKLKADTYLSGKFGRDYLDESKFRENNIRVMYQDFKHPIYNQMHGEFISGLAAIDLLFNCGPESIQILTSTE